MLFQIQSLQYSFSSEAAMLDAYQQLEFALTLLRREGVKSVQRNEGIMGKKQVTRFPLRNRGEVTVISCNLHRNTCRAFSERWSRGF